MRHRRRTDHLLRRYHLELGPRIEIELEQVLEQLDSGMVRFLEDRS